MSIVITTVYTDINNIITIHQNMMKTPGDKKFD